MFERLTERARQVVVLADQTARELGHEHLGTEHLLVGLAAEQKGLASWATGFSLDSLGRDFDDLYAAVVRIAGRGERPTEAQLPFTAAATRALELASVEVDRRRLNFIATEHLLLGLLDQLDAEPAGDVALQALTELGITTRQLRETVERFVHAPKGGLSWMLRRTPGVEFRGVQGAGWIDVLELQPDVHLRRLLVRAATAALDDQRTVIEARDLLAAFSALPEGAELLGEAGVTVPSPTIVPVQGQWTRIDAGDQVLAAVTSAQRRTRESGRDTVTLDDLLLVLVDEQASLLGCSGWDLTAVRALLEQRRAQRDPG